MKKISFLLFITIFTSFSFARVVTNYYVDSSDFVTFEKPAYSNYIGLGFGSTSVSDDYLLNGESEITALDYASFLLKAGYKFNKNISIEARYWKSLSNYNQEVYTTLDIPQDGSYDSAYSAGLYFKPQLYIIDPLSVYTLFGAAFSSIDGKTQWDKELISDLDFSWGIGAEFSIDDRLSFFIDYSTLFDNYYSFDSYYKPQLTNISNTSFGFNFNF